MGKSLLHLSVALLLGLLSACGGGNGVIYADHGDSANSPIPVQGTWTGTLNVNGGSGSGAVNGAIVEAGFAFFFDQSGVLYVLPQLTGDSLQTGTLTALAPAGGIFPDGQTRDTFSLTVTVSGSGIMGSFSGNGETGDFTLTPAMPLTGGNPSVVAGNWQGFYIGSGSEAVDITLQPGGVFVGNDAAGCNLNGHLTQLQSGQDLFGVTADSTGSSSTCLGSLQGLAFEGNADVTGLFGGTRSTYYYVALSSASGAFVAELKVQ